MLRQLFQASGFLCILVAPSMLMIGIAVDTPILAFAVIMIGLPLLRPLTGPLPDEPIQWRESIATALHLLPVAYGALLISTITFVLHELRTHGIPSFGYGMAIGLSLWLILLLSTCVAHELIHQRQRLHCWLGVALAGFAGYPLLHQEHFGHHARPGDTEGAAWPRTHESACSFAARRIKVTVMEAYGPASPLWLRPPSTRATSALRVATGVCLATAAAFWMAAGFGGLVLYVCVVGGVCFGVQLITYIQHWGLGDDRQGASATQGLGWEDDCRLQAWLTLGVSLHHQHHKRSHLPYYHLTLADDSPRLPANYVILLVLCLVFPLWLRSMQPALKHWEANPSDPRSSGRRLTCFYAYDRSNKPLIR
ncbi:fatty acid desaturase [Aquabacterium sp. J223]|uniref:fatty acid desaturase n=1 Tax=Aquabacterium sp. J223 TaxID=2898431 RepID=UPI0021AD5CA8|nr:fatty acid desaturase [Aquabacterium sp. J223]UUX95366.1 fatty acid desaturase [Aquabacterium sp. J223]